MKLLVQRLSKKGTVIQEPTITDDGELKEPDIVFHRDGNIKILDVTVVYEKDNYLAHAADVKKEKYKGTAEIIRRQLNGRKAEVLPIVIGSRGTIQRDTASSFKLIGIGIRDTPTMSLMALRSSIQIANKFIDYEQIEI